MALVYVTRKEHFNAAHKLENPNWTQEENERIFGKCANKNWHGHNYQLFVTVKGEPMPDTGYVIDLKALSTIIKKTVVDKLDHSNINMDVDFMKGKMTSTENLAIAIWNELAPHITGATLHCIRLYETENNFVEYFGD